jgi:hypothetical protein
MAEGLIDIHQEGSAKTNKVDTEHLLKVLEWKTIEAGVNKYSDLQTYRNCVEQMEILATGSTLLNKVYFAKKKTLSEKLVKSQVKLTKEIRPGIKKSQKNVKIKEELHSLEVDFVTEWHRLLMHTLGKLFYTHYKIERI